MRKFLSTLIALFMFSVIYAQGNFKIKGITVTGIKGITKSLTDVIANERRFPVNYKVRLKPELEGPEPKGQNPNAKAVSRFGTAITGNNYRTTATSTPTQPVASNFLAIWGSYAAVANRESPYTPPDNNGDVGTTQIVATANCRMKVFDKPSPGAALTTATGSSTEVLNPVVNIDLNTFFSVSSIGVNSISDPHVRFDRLTGRWFIVAIDVNHTTGSNYCLVAVSDGSAITATSNFKIFYFSVAGTGGASNDFFDYPTLGVDKNYLYIGGNMFANGSSFSGSNMWVVDKSKLVAPSPTLSVTGFPHSNANKTDIYTPQGVHNDDPQATEGYFIGASQTLYSKLVIKRVNYGGGTPTLSADLPLTTATTYSPQTVPTKGGVAIDGNDRRLCAAMIKKNKITGVSTLWVAQGTLLDNTGVGGTGGDRDGALWMEIENLKTTPDIRQSATLYDPNNVASPENYTYPTIALSGQGHNIMGFTSAGGLKYAQAGVAGRYRNDPPGNFQSPVDITTTTSTYNPGAIRWGDYTQTVVDPLDDMTMWTFTEYAPATNAWGVRAAQFKAPPPATPVLATVPACGATTNVVINGTATANPNAEFFDPGDDIAAGGPGFNRLKIDVSGPSLVSVSNITFKSPTLITADFAVPSNAIGGTYTLTVTNPDGQTSTTTFSLSCTPTSCGNSSNLTSSAVDNNSEIISWSAVAGADYYIIEYQIPGALTWSTASASGTNVLSTTLAGLNAGTTYNWQITAHCPGGPGNPVGSTFTTTSPCNAPSPSPASNVTSSSATLSWTLVSGAVSYKVQHAPASTSAWVTDATATTSPSINITGLNPSTSYDWHVLSNCSNGSSAYSPTQTFSTGSAPTTCTDSHEPNNSTNNATAINVATDITGTIGTSSDVDYFRFSTTSSQRNLRVTLTNLPANYSLTLYNSNGKQLAVSAQSGTTSEAVAYNSGRLASYIVKVSGVSGAFSTSQCYTLRATISSSTFTADAADQIIDDISMVKGGGLRLYPVPATNAVTISFDALAKGIANVTIVNQLGQPVLIKKLLVNEGTNFNTIDVGLLKSGVYTLKLNNVNNIQTQKLVIAK